MGFFDFIKGAGEDISEEELAEQERETADKMLRAKLQRHLRHKGLEEKIEGLALEVEDDRVTISGTVKNEDIREIVVLSVGNFQGVAGVQDNLQVPVVAEPAPEPKKEVVVVSSAAVEVVKSAPSQPEPSRPKSVFHTVVSGDTLWAISEKYLGDGNKYTAIFEANRPMLKDPDSIYPGQKLRIPK